MPAVAEHEFHAQLFLVVEAGDGARERLAAALGVGAASVLIVPGAGVVLDAAAVSPLVHDAQAAGAAALIYGDAALARQFKADGVHLPQDSGDDLIERYDQARKMIGPQGIVGAHAEKSRHDAMTLGEAGADYVAFGVPSDVQDVETARAHRLDLVTWWAEIFEVPCVALDVQSPSEALELARTGADFIGITLPNGQSPAQSAERVREIANVLAAVPAT
jgi:thiamine-phosphate pyrophosphorylase